MAVDAYIYFSVPAAAGFPLPDGETTDDYFSKKKAFEIKEFSFDIEQAQSVGSATGGAGTGKVKFNEFTIKKTTDYASPIFFKNCVSGAHYDKVVVAIRKSGGSPKAGGQPYLEYCFKMVFTTKIEWSGPGDEGPEESITFAYGGLGIRYRTQNEDGTLAAAKRMGWSQVNNKAETLQDSDFSGA